jgi:ubiquinone/menaquinone biosynthesis C-methylase UbiE
MQRRFVDTGIEAFTAVASTYDAWFASPFGVFIDDLEKQALARALQDADGALVLDIGAGTGHISAWLADRGYHVIAVEPSLAMRAEGRHPTAGLPISWCSARAEALPFERASVDGAILFTTLEFVSDPVRALHEAMRVVRPEGWVVVGFLHALSPWAALYRYRADQGEMPWSAAQWLTRDDIESSMGAAAKQSETAVHLAPQAAEPFSEAERAGIQAGNRAAVEILRWEKRS